MNIALIIPARYGSTRFPGKPLVKIAGETMLSRVVNVGRTICEKHPNITDRKSTRLNSSHDQISYAVYCLKKKIHNIKLQKFDSDI